MIHNHEVPGSIPGLATRLLHVLCAFYFFLLFRAPFEKGSFFYFLIESVWGGRLFIEPLLYQAEAGGESDIEGYKKALPRESSL